MNNTFTDTLWKVEKMLDEASRIAQTARIHGERGNISEAFDESLHLTRLSEKITLHARQIPVYTGNPRAQSRVKTIVSEECSCEIGYMKGKWFSIRIPMLLPHRRSPDIDYLRETFYPAIGNYIAKHNENGKIYGPVVMVFRHVYTAKSPERKRRDHDNYETKAMADIIALSLLIDDAPAYCSHYHCTAEGSSERTEIYLIPKDDFASWFVFETIMPKEGETLYERTQKA